MAAEATRAAAVDDRVALAGIVFVLKTGSPATSCAPRSSVVRDGREHVVGEPTDRAAIGPGRLGSFHDRGFRPGRWGCGRTAHTAGQGQGSRRSPGVTLVASSSALPEGAYELIDDQEPATLPGWGTAPRRRPPTKGWSPSGAARRGRHSRGGRGRERVASRSGPDPPGGGGCSRCSGSVCSCPPAVSTHRQARRLRRRVRQRPPGDQAP
jgi:hypothetical protein